MMGRRSTHQPSHLERRPPYRWWMSKRGAGSVRERRPGVWEIRVVTGSDPVTGRTTYRSVTFTGSPVDAERYAAELAAEYRARRSVAVAAPMLTVEELLTRWLDADSPLSLASSMGPPPRRAPSHVRNHAPTTAPMPRGPGRGERRPACRRCGWSDRPACTNPIAVPDSLPSESCRGREALSVSRVPWREPSGQYPVTSRRDESARAS